MRTGAEPAALAASAATLCFHCASPLPASGVSYALVGGQREPMCCPGCAAVARLIEETGMSGYYRARSAPARTQAGAGTEARQANSAGAPMDAAVFDDPGLQKGFVARADIGGALEAHLQLQHVRCGACSWLIEGHLRAQPGVLSAQVNTVAGRLVLRWDPAQISLSTMILALRRIGYDAHPWQAGAANGQEARERRRRVAELVVAGLGMMQVMMYAIPVYLADSSDMSAGEAHLMDWASLVLTLPVMLFSAQGIFIGAWRTVRARRLGMDVPVAIGLLAAFLGSLASLWRGHGPVWFDSVTMFVFLLLASRWLEQEVRARALALTAHLAPAVPAQALLVTPGTDRVMPVAVVGLKAGDRIRVPVGESIPVDGRIVAGAGPVAEALLTGESAPRWRATGDCVLAGSLNLAEVLDIDVDAVGAHSVLARILRRMDQALAERAPLAGLADRAAARFVAGLLLITVVTGLTWWWLAPQRALGIVIAVLVVSCPCALSLAVPATLAASTARLARRGLLLLEGHALETLGSARTFVFDKTGTLTEGRPQVRITWGDTPPAQRAALAAVALGLEAHQPHPFAVALCAALQAEFPGLVAAPIGQRITHLARGVEGVVDGATWRIGMPSFVAALAATPQAELAPGSAAWLGDAQGVRMRCTFVDALRPGAAGLIEALQRAGARVALLSGDQPEAVALLAGQLGIQEARGGLAPEDKLAAIRVLQTEGPVVMVGDGLNDAPGFGAADLAIAVGQVTQSLARGAGAIVPDGDLASLSAGVGEARGALRRVRQNLVWALVYNLGAIPLAALGWLTPWEAGLGMSLSSLLVVINGMRPWKS